MEQPISITSRDYWFKVVGMLQQNGALIERVSADGCRVYFISDSSGVFDELEFADMVTAEAALRRNGFARFDDDKEAQKFLSTPSPPYFRRPHPNGPIYSSGWYRHLCQG
jgi:hypothetical protein